MKKKLKFFVFISIALTLAVSLSACVTTKVNEAERAYSALSTALTESGKTVTYYVSEYYKEEGKKDGDTVVIPTHKQTKKTEVLCDTNTFSGKVYYESDGITPRNYQIRTEFRDANYSLVYESYALEGYVYTNDAVGNRSKRAQAQKDYIASDEFTEYSLEYYLTDLTYLLNNREYIEFDEKNAYIKKGKTETVVLRVLDGFEERFFNEYGRASCFVNSESVSVETAYGKISDIICRRKDTPVKELTFLSVNVEIYELYIVYNGPKILLPSDFGKVEAADEPAVPAVTKPKASKEEIFVWIILGAAVLAVGAFTYILLRKKK